MGVNRLSQQAKAHLLKLMYKRSQNDIYLSREEVRTRLHDAPVLFVLFPNNETFKKSIILRGSKSNAWNALKVEERNIPTFERFKSMLKDRQR